MGCSSCSKTKRISYGSSSSSDVFHSISGSSQQVIKQYSLSLLNSKKTSVVNTNILRKKNLNVTKTNFKLLQF